MVGAVIVHEGRIIGEGWHRRYGGPHAEVNAVRSVRPEDEALLPHSTIYVSLEPCSHWGKTPPCAELLVEKGFRRVVVGCLDPNEKVAGRGITRLREAGVEVIVGVLEDDKRDELMDALKCAKGFIRRSLGKRMIIRYTPELIFVADKNIEYGVHIAKVLADTIRPEEKEDANGTDEEES